MKILYTWPTPGEQPSFLVNRSVVDGWQSRFPDLNVAAEFSLMDSWLTANPSKSKSNYQRFILNWLKGETRSLRSVSPIIPPAWIAERRRRELEKDYEITGPWLRDDPRCAGLAALRRAVDS